MKTHNKISLKQIRETCCGISALLGYTEKQINKMSVSELTKIMIDQKNASSAGMLALSFDSPFGSRREFAIRHIGDGLRTHKIGSNITAPIMERNDNTDIISLYLN